MLRFGFRVNKICQPLCFGKIQLAVDKCAAGKFTRFRQTQAGLPGKIIKHRFHHRPATMQMQLHHLLTGETMGGREVKTKGMVKKFFPVF
jgi:hypothetical protein